MKKEKARRLAKRITAFAAAVAMAATFTFPAEVGDGFFDGFGNAIVASAETGNFTVTGGTEGTDYSYADNVLTILTETPLTISGTTTTDRIEVASGVSANITLAGVNIDVSGTSYACAFKIADNSTGNVTITLADGSENTLKSGLWCAGLQKNGNAEGIGKLTIKGGTNGTGKLTAISKSRGAGIGGDEYDSGSNIEISGGIITATGSDGAGIGGGWKSSGSDITISGGTITASGGTYAAGIGGGSNGSASSITIKGGTVTATGGYQGAGIGGGCEGSGSDITISGGIVTVTGGKNGAGIGGGAFAIGSEIIITGGSVKLVKGQSQNTIGGGYNQSAVIPTLADGTTKVFLYKITGASSIEIDGVSYPTTHNGENLIYPYLSAGYHTVKIDGTEKTIHIAENGTITDPATPATQGAFEIYGGELNTDYSYSGGVLTIKTATPLMIKNTTPTTATTDRIEVADGVSANITLAGVNISSSYNAVAFKIADNSTGNVTVNLVGENMLKSGSRYAGLQKNGNAEGIGKLTIKGGTNGTGKLTATGGMTGAGIGGGNYGSCSNIEISGGTVTATGGENGAGIGGGDSGSGSSITISGGTVTATGGGYGAGIGGGSQGDGSDIIISGGTVAATGGPWGAGIGGGHSGTGSYITISGGTVTAKGVVQGAGIGGGFCSSGSYITISGGTVTAIGGEYGAGIGGGNRGSGSYITISGGTVTATGGRNGAGIGGGDYGQASDIRISGGSVNAVAGENANAIGGGFNQSAVIPTLADGAANVYLLTIENPDGKDVFIDGSTTPYKPSNHSAAGTGDTNLYAYLTGETHKVKIGDEETEYKFYTNKFLPVPKASDFTFTAPTAPIVYDNTAKEATVTGISGTGTVTVKYYLVEGDTETLLTDDNKPVNAGTYKVKIDVEKGTSYADVQELTADEWKFTITSGTLTAADFDFTKPSNLVYDGNAKTATVTANSGITGIGTITVKYQKTGDTTATTEAPKTPGTYKVSIDVTAGTNYAAATDLTADTWTFTITAGTLKASDFTFTAPTNPAYDGSEKTATVTAKDGITGIGTITVKYYDAAGNKLDSAPIDLGTYTVKIDVTAGTNYAAVIDLTADEWTFTINRAATTVTAPTATAITYGQALSASTLSDTNWSWVDGTVIPDVQNNGYPAKITVDDIHYDFTNFEGYNSEAHTVTRTIAVSVNKATPTITVTASPTSDIAGKTVTVSAVAVNPNNSTLTDVPAPTLTYKVGDSGTETTFTGSFVIPEGTADGTIITITAATAENGSYEAGANTATVTVTDCLHTDKTAAWEKDSTGHWHICNYCGAEVDKAAHSEDSGTVTTEPTETTEGIKTYKCTVCGYVTRTETIAVLDHTHVPSEEYSKDETGHWHTCSGCTEKLDLAAHTYGNWKITVPATAQANGKKERSCTICGYVQEGTVIYGGEDTTGDIDNATKPENNACHADLELTDEEIINKIPLTPEELEAIENGADLEVYMVVIDYSGNVPSADKDLAEAVLTDGMKIGMYIDVTLFVKVGDNDPRAVTNTNGELKITFEMPEKLINTDKNTTRKYSIIRVHNGEAAILDCAYDKTTAKGSFVTDKFSTYAIAYNDITEGKPAPVVRYPIVINGNVTVDKTTAAAGETVNVRTDFGYDIIVTAANGQRIAQITEKGSFTMPACKVSVTAVQNETFALMSTAWRNSYVYSYDADMNKIKVNSTKKRGVIIVNLGEEYAGRTFTIYSGRKSTKVKVTEGEFDENGKFIFEVPDGKNYTLVVED